MKPKIYVIFFELKIIKVEFELYDKKIQNEHFTFYITLVKFNVKFIKNIDKKFGKVTLKIKVNGMIIKYYINTYGKSIYCRNNNKQTELNGDKYEIINEEEMIKFNLMYDKVNNTLFKIDKYPFIYKCTNAINRWDLFDYNIKNIDYIDINEF